MPAAFTMDDWNSAVRALRNGSVAGLLAMHESGAVSESEAVGAIAGLWYENPWQGVAVLCQLREQPSEAARRIAALVGNLSLPAPGRRWTDAANQWLFSPRVRIIWTLVCLAVVVISISWDWLARSRGWQSLLAPTAFDLWLSIGFGLLVGAIGAVWERFLLTHRRADQLEFFRSSLRERLKWRYQRINLRQNAWFLLSMYALIGWCVYSRVSILPALFAANIMFIVNGRLAAEFRTRLAARIDA